MSTLNVDKVDPSTGTTLELGTSGDTVNLGSGVTAGTGFGGDLSFGGDTFGEDKTIGANDAYSFSLETSGNTALTIDANGQVGIGTTSISAPTTDYRTLEIKNTASSGRALLALTGNSSEYSHLYFGDENDVNIGGIQYYHGNDNMYFRTNTATATQIDSSGHIYMPDASDAGRIDIMSGYTNPQIILRGPTTSNTNKIVFYNGNGAVGSITTNGSATAFNTSSDYRLKENETSITDGIDRIKQLKPYRFNFKTDATKTVDGFFAHEVSGIVPEAISGEKDAMHPEVLYADEVLYAEEVLYTADDELPEGKEIGDIKYAIGDMKTPADELPEGKNFGDVKEETKINPQGIDQAKLVPLLVKTIQELEARITELENA